MTQCHKLFYTINGNLYRLWGVKTNVVFQILNACVLSILDYSSLIILLIKEYQRKDLRTMYNKFI